VPVTPTGNRQSGDVLVEATYSPMSKIGPVTGRKYPRTGLNRPLWVAREDADARPDWWRVVAPNPEDVSPDVDTVLRLVEEGRAPALDEMSRDEIRATLDEMGVDYNARRSTENLRKRLEEELRASHRDDAGSLAAV
jgi:hypothetical protein